MNAVLLAGFISTSITSVAQKAEKPGVMELETVIVTAPLNKTFEVSAGAFGAKDIMEIPLAIQSYNAKAIATISARTAADVLVFDSSVLNASFGSSFDNFRLRGFSMDSFNTIRRDGLSLAPHHDFALELVERIDVLKGPSGFLYGFNSPGGTINYLLKRPTKDPLLNLTLQGSSLEGSYGAIDTSSSVADGMFGYRLNAGYEKTGDFDHARDLERKFVGITTDLRLSDQALLHLNADWSFKSVVADPLLRADQRARTNTLDPSSYVLPPEIERRDLLTGSWYRHETEGSNVDAKLTLTLNDHWFFIIQANYSRVERHGGYNDLFNIQPNGDIGYADFYTSRGELFSAASLQTYLSAQFSAIGIEHDLFVGASATEFEDEAVFWDFVESTNGVSINSVSVGNILKPIEPPRWDFGPEPSVEFTSNIKEQSVFASDLVSLSEQFQLLLGGRYIWYRAKNLSATALPQEKNVFVPMVALIFRPSDNAMTYASYSRSFEKGEYAPFFANNANQPTDAIESQQYEVGVKMEFDSRLSMEAAVFDIRRDASYVNLHNDFVSDGQYHHRGVELNVIGRVSNGFTVRGNVAFLSTELGDVTDSFTLGKRSEGVPDWSAGLRGHYAIGSVPGLSVDGAISFVDSRPVDAQNSGYIPSYFLLDAGISYETELADTDVIVRLHGKNLTDEYYYAGTYYQAGLEIGRTREVFLSVQFKL